MQTSFIIIKYQCKRKAYLVNKACVFRHFLLCVSAAWMNEWVHLVLDNKHKWMGYKYCDFKDTLIQWDVSLWTISLRFRKAVLRVQILAICFAILEALGSSVCLLWSKERILKMSLNFDEGTAPIYVEFPFELVFHEVSTHEDMADANSTLSCSGCSCRERWEMRSEVSGSCGELCWTTDANTCSCNKVPSVRLMWTKQISDQISICRKKLCLFYNGKGNDGWQYGFNSSKTLAFRISSFGLITGMRIPQRSINKLPEFQLSRIPVMILLLKLLSCGENHQILLNFYLYMNLNISTKPLTKVWFSF